MRSPWELMVACALLALISPGCALLGVPPVSGCHGGEDELPPAASRPALARFVVMGDFGDVENGSNEEVALAMRDYFQHQSLPVDRVFELGDNFYPNGLVGVDGDCDEEDVQLIAAQARSVVTPFEFIRDRGLTLTLVPGNHDHSCGDVGLDNQHNLDRWLQPMHRWGVQWDLRQGEPQPLVLNRQVQIIFLDSGRMISDGEFRDASAERLRQLLSRGPYRRRIIAAHHPLYTSGTHNGAWWEGTLKRVGALLVLPLHGLAALGVPGFDWLTQDAHSVRYVAYRRAVERAIADSGARVDLFMAGHDHNLQLIDRSAARQPAVLVAGSVANCSPVYAAPDTLFAAAKNGFAVVSAFEDHMEAEFYATTPCDETETCPFADDRRAHLLSRFRLE